MSKIPNQAYRATPYVAAISGVAGYRITRGVVTVELATGDKVALTPAHTPPLARMSCFTLADAVKEQGGAS